MLARHLIGALTGGGRGGSGGGSIPDSLLAFWNGKVGSNPQQILASTSTDNGSTWTIANGSAAVFQVSGAGGWYDEHVAQCCLLAEGSGWSVYLSGYDGTNWRIGRWTSSTLTSDPGSWFADAGNPIIDLGAGGDPDEDGANFPQCEYDSTTGTTRIWYTGWSTFTTICYAERSSGGTITKYGRMLNVGAGGSFDDAGQETGPRVTLGGEKRIYFDGYDGAKWTQSYATYTDPRDSGTYTKQGTLPTLTGPISVDEGSYDSVHLHSLVQLTSGSYLGFLTLFHPTGSANQREISATATTGDGITFAGISGPIFTMSTAYPGVESRENPAVLITS